MNIEEIIKKIESFKEKRSSTAYGCGFNDAIDRVVSLLESQPITPSPSPVTWEEAWQLAIQYADEQNILHHQPSGIMYERAALDYVKDYLSRSPLHPPMEKWIPVSERLPDNDDLVLICGDFPSGVDVFGQTHYYSGGYWWNDNSGEPVTDAIVTHWRELPPSPQK